MAWRMKLKLPAFKVTQRCSSGVVSHSIVARQSTHQAVNVGEEICNDGASHKESSDQDDDFDSMWQDSQWHPSTSEHCELTEPSLHEIKQKSNVRAWGKIRQTLLETSVEGSALCNNQQCILCENDGIYRCVQCAPWAHYCSSCFNNAHSKVNIFHVGEIWEDGVYKPVIQKDRVVDVRQPHSCSESQSIPLCCVDANGAEHNVLFVCCPCEPSAATMVRAHLWPSTPQHPRLAFTFELLDWIEALLLECHVALKDFCKALYFKCPHFVNKRKDVYPSLIDSFEEYRYMKVELRHLHFLCSDLDIGNVCPACPKESGNIILSMDGLFGLPRKKSAGKSFRDALHGDVFFGNQQSVDEFVKSAGTEKKAVAACSDFLAGDALRSSKRYHALDETAVFGCACRHEFPLLFIDLKHGERLSYVDWMLQEIIQRQPKEINIRVMYDVACSLIRHVQNQHNAVLERIQLALPSFHAYGHKAACQVLYSPLRCDGFGMSDGEVMERLWSYLRRFSRMTKEMRPAHRTDVLSHALVYYGLKTKQKLAPLLLRRWRKAKEMNTVALENYTKLVSSLDVPVTDETVQSWIAQETNVISHEREEKTITVEWKTQYFHMLKCFYTTRDNLVGASLDLGPSELRTLRGKVLSMESQLADFERRHNINHRWIVSDPEYIESKQCFLKETQEQLLSCLWGSVVRRHYLLKMKARYADGQKIAKRLSKNITKETKKIKQLLEQYNMTSAQLTEHFAPVPLSEAISVTSDFWLSLDCDKHTSSAVPWHIKRDIVQAYLLIKRSNEETQLLEQEMHNVISYWETRKKCISAQLQQMDVNKQFHRGAVCLFKKQLWEIEFYHQIAVSLFSSIVHVPPVYTSTSQPTMHIDSGSGSSEYEVGDSDDEIEDSDDSDEEDFDPLL